MYILEESMFVRTKVLMEMKVSVTGKYRINEIKFGYLKMNLIFDTMSREMKVRAEISVEF